VALGVLSLVISFLPEKYSFFVLRAVAGIAGGALVPAAYRLIVYVRPVRARNGIHDLRPQRDNGHAVRHNRCRLGRVHPLSTGQQMHSWRWFFRIARS
jgi:hypothetical protein